MRKTIDNSSVIMVLYLHYLFRGCTKGTIFMWNIAFGIIIATVILSFLSGIIKELMDLL